MALVNRFSRLFTADFNALLDRIEEPEVLLKQAVRDMQHELDELKRRGAALDQAARQLERESAALARNERQIGEELELCLDAREDNLARTLIRRQLECERTRARIERDVQANADARTHVSRAIEDGERQLGERREQLDVLLSAPVAGDFNQPAIHDTSAISDADIDVALLRARQRRAAR